MPATSKVLGIIDRGVQDRVTKNGETLRRHAESAQRWKSLRERIARTDTELESVRKILLNEDTPSEHDSTTSGTASSKNGNGYLSPGNGSQISRVSSSSTNMSGSISPFRKLARKFSGQPKTSPQTLVSPLAVTKKVATNAPSEPSMSPVPQVHTIRRQRTSIFGTVRGTAPPPPVTPERPSHKHSQSYTPDSSPHGSKIEKPDFSPASTSRATGPLKQRWNSSTKVEPEDRNNNTKSLPRRPPSSSGFYGNNNDDIPPVPPIAASYRRSLSRASMASSRPWSPVTSSISTTNSQPVLLHTLRPASRAQTPSRPFTPGLATTPRTRPRTPSHIPAPKSLRSVSGSKSVAGLDDEESYFNRSFSPTSNASPTGSSFHPPRPPSRSMIPVPSVHLHTPSRPGSSLSNFSSFNGPESPTMRSFRASALRAQTPEHLLRARAQQVPVFQGTIARPRLSSYKLPPSSFRDGSGSVSRASSRPSSRNGAYTPSMDQPIHEYIPGNNYDPLDAEVAAIVNSIPHGLLIERVDPPLKKSQIPKEGEEVKAQYATTNASGRRIITCRLTTLTRAGKAGSDPSTTKKVMVRVGGGMIRR